MLQLHIVLFTILPDLQESLWRASQHSHAGFMKRRHTVQVQCNIYLIIAEHAKTLDTFNIG